MKLISVHIAYHCLVFFSRLNLSKIIANLTLSLFLLGSLKQNLQRYKKKWRYYSKRISVCQVHMILSFKTSVNVLRRCVLFYNSFFNYVRTIKIVHKEKWDICKQNRPIYTWYFSISKTLLPGWQIISRCHQMKVWPRWKHYLRKQYRIIWLYLTNSMCFMFTVPMLLCSNEKFRVKELHARLKTEEERHSLKTRRLQRLLGIYRSLRIICEENEVPVPSSERFEDAQLLESAEVCSIQFFQLFFIHTSIDLITCLCTDFSVIFHWVVCQ